MGELSPRQYALKIKEMCLDIRERRARVSILAGSVEGFTKNAKEVVNKAEEHLKDCRYRYAQAIYEKEILDKGEGHRRSLKQSIREEKEEKFAEELNNIKKPNYIARFFAAMGITFVSLLVLCEIIQPEGALAAIAVILMLMGSPLMGFAYAYKNYKDYNKNKEDVVKKIDHETEIQFNEIINSMHEHVENIPVYEQEVKQAETVGLDEAKKAAEDSIKSAERVKVDMENEYKEYEQARVEMRTAMNECGFPKMFETDMNDIFAVCDYIINGVAETFKEAAQEHKHDLDNKRMQEKIAAQQQEMEERHNREMAAMQQTMNEGMNQLGAEMRKTQEENARMQAQYAEAQARYAENQERHNKEMEYLQKERLKEERKQREELERLNYKMNE